MLCDLFDAGAIRKTEEGRSIILLFYTARRFFPFVLFDSIRRTFIKKKKK